MSAVKRPFVSATCRDGGHGFCSGRRYVMHDGGGAVYAKCQCSCHRDTVRSVPHREQDA